MTFSLNKLLICCFWQLSDVRMMNTFMCQQWLFSVKGVIGYKIHFTCCLNIIVCWKCVYCRHPPNNDTNSPSGFFKIPILKSIFSNQAVLRFLSEWRSSVQAPPTIVDWQGRLDFWGPYAKLCCGGVGGGVWKNGWNAFVCVALRLEKQYLFRGSVRFQRHSRYMIWLIFT